MKTTEIVTMIIAIAAAMVSIVNMISSILQYRNSSKVSNITATRLKRYQDDQKSLASLYSASSLLINELGDIHENVRTIVEIASFYESFLYYYLDIDRLKLNEIRLLKDLAIKKIDNSWSEEDKKAFGHHLKELQKNSTCISHVEWYRIKDEAVGRTCSYEKMEKMVKVNLEKYKTAEKEYETAE